MSVTIEKNQASVPSDQDITTAMTSSGSTVAAITGNNASKTVDFTGTVNHTTFENELIEVARGRRTSWNFVWADADDDADDELGATPYEIDITMSPDTVTALVNGNYNMYGFKAVQAAQGGGAPLVWFQLPKTSYSTLTKVAWEVQYQAYTSTSKIISGGSVTASFSADIDLEQVLNVTDGGIGQVTSGGASKAISILNTISQQFTCGISQQAADGSDNPMCAFPLYGQQLDVIAPIEKVLLMFSTTPVDTGTVIEQAYSPGILIDLTSLNQRAITYDINYGWTWGGFNWAQSVPARSKLVPLLIENANTSSPGTVRRRSLVSG